jgi:hypothetical protein
MTTTTSPQVVNVKTNMETGKYIAIKAPKIEFNNEYTFSPLQAFTRNSLIYIVYKIKNKEKNKEVIIEYVIYNKIIKANMLFPTYRTIDGVRQYAVNKFDQDFFKNFGSILDLVLSICFSDIKELYDIPTDGTQFRPISLEQFTSDNDNVFSTDETNDETIKTIIKSLIELKKIIHSNIKITYTDCYVLIDFDLTQRQPQTTSKIPGMYKEFTTFITKFMVEPEDQMKIDKFITKFMVEAEDQMKIDDPVAKEAEAKQKEAEALELAKRLAERKRQKEEEAEALAKRLAERKRQKEEEAKEAKELAKRLAERRKQAKEAEALKKNSEPPNKYPNPKRPRVEEI